MKFREPLPKTPKPIRDGHQGEYIRGKWQDDKGVWHIDYGFCPECYCQTYVRDYHHGESVCPVCGLVIEDTLRKGATQQDEWRQKPRKAQRRFNKYEREYIQHNKLHLRHLDQRYTYERMYAYRWRVIKQYAPLLNIGKIDQENIYQFVTHEKLHLSQCNTEQIILGVMKYIAGTQKYQNPKINTSPFKEAGLTKEKYNQIIKFLFNKDKEGTYGIVREKDKHNKYYDWVWDENAQ